MKSVVLIAMAIGVARVAAAQEDAKHADRGPYVGLSVGSFSYEENDPFFSVHVDDTTSAYRIIAGYRFGEHFAFEGSWGETGDLEDSGTSPLSPGATQISLQGEYEVLTIRALGILPLNDKVSLYGGLGYYDAELDATITLQNLTSPGPGWYTVERGDAGATLVGGVELKLERMNIRAEIEKFDADANSDAWSFNVGMLFRF